MLPTLHIGPLAIQTPGLIILLGLGLGLFLAERQASRYQINGGLLYNLAFLGLVSGVVGARLACVIHYPSAFAANPGSLFSLNLALFEPVWGSVIGLCIAGLYGWSKHMPLKSALDALTSALAVLAVAYHLAQFASGDAYGAPANLPWAIELWGTRRHPTQIYESLAAIAILWAVWPRPAWFEVAGQRIIAFISLSAGARLFLEAFRGDSLLWAGFRSAQVVAWLILAFSLWVSVKYLTKPTEKPDETNHP